MRTWFLFNSRQGNQTEVDEAHLGRFLREIPEDDLPYSYVWQGGWKHWVPLAKIPELMSLRYMAPPPPPALGTRYPPERKSEVEMRQEREFTGSSMIESFQLQREDSKIIAKPSVSPLKVARGRDKERRASKRVEGRLKVMVKVGEQIFRTYTSNTSIHGVLLGEPVPSTMLDQQVEMYIYSPDLKSCLRLSARIIEDQKIPQRLKFVEADDLSERRLLSWITTLSSEGHKIASQKK